MDLIKRDFLRQFLVEASEQLLHAKLGLTPIYGALGDLSVNQGLKELTTILELHRIAKLFQRNCGWQRLLRHFEIASAEILRLMIAQMLSSRCTNLNVTRAL